MLLYDSCCDLVSRLEISMCKFIFLFDYKYNIKKGYRKNKTKQTKKSSNTLFLFLGSVKNYTKVKMGV